MVAVDFLEGPAGLHRRTTHDLVTDDDDDDALTSHQSPQIQATNHGRQICSVFFSEYARVCIFLYYKGRDLKIQEWSNLARPEPRRLGGWFSAQASSDLQQMIFWHSRSVLVHTSVLYLHCQI